VKRNRFRLALVPAVSSAMLAFGCGRPQQAPPTATASDSSQVCVDGQGRRVADDQCRDDRPTYRSNTFYHWYHVSHGGAMVPIGGAVFGHSFSHGSTSQSSSSHRASVSRGGFGSSAHGGGAGA
jgi:hypothetical protein